MRVSYAMPSASRVSAACFIVAQSDWLPMITATGFADTGMILNAAPMFRPRKGADYRNRPQGRKPNTPSAPSQPSAALPSRLNEPLPPPLPPRSADQALAHVSNGLAWLEARLKGATETVRQGTDFACIKMGISFCQNRQSKSKR